MTNSERRISRQRAFLPLPGEAKPDWWIVTQVARRMGYGDAFAYECAADIFREHAALSAFENDGTRDFDIGALADISDAVLRCARSCRLAGPQRPQRRYALLRRWRLLHARPQGALRRARSPGTARDASNEYPFVLNTGRVRDQWHTMTRTGLSPRLGQHTPEPFVEIHPDDAAALELKDFARVATAHGEGIFKVALNDGQQRGSVFVPIHWNGETASAARVCELVAPHTDPFSGQPEAKATPASVTPVEFAWRGFALTPHALRAAARDLVGAGRAQRRHRHADRIRRRAEALARARP